MLDGLTAFDIAVFAIVGFAAVAGLARGFVGEIASLFAWVAGVLAVRYFHTETKIFVGSWMESEAGASIVALVGLFFGAFIVVRLVGDAMSRSTKASVIGPIDRLLGLGFGAAKGVVAATLMFLLATMAVSTLFPGQPQPQWMLEARTVPTLAIVSRALLDFVDDGWRLDGSVAGDPHSGLGIPPAFGPSPDQEGYGSGDRKALDELLDQQEKQIPSTPI
ncbi:membrane protein required for colicin V production [Polymorphobacter multimanifer]|uniref:Membrane protein required for colicin V production n=1 Tax=Polymorphobacter multimanifer TaxID=1070431 RepID=A0A841L3U2_9SPHN|nr:CvpA family protein [Polymorphobacter multimanifer]MBB6227304.1 membrane protein required for colicin V production [Polymorphobacter multimanifer]